MARTQLERELIKENAELQNTLDAVTDLLVERGVIDAGDDEDSDDEDSDDEENYAVGDLPDI